MQAKFLRKKKKRKKKNIQNGRLHTHTLLRVCHASQMIGQFFFLRSRILHRQFPEIAFGGANKEAIWSTSNSFFVTLLFSCVCLTTVIILPINIIIRRDRSSNQTFSRNQFRNSNNPLYWCLLSQASSAT